MWTSLEGPLFIYKTIHLLCPWKRCSLLATATDPWGSGSPISILALLPHIVVTSTLTLTVKWQHLASTIPESSHFVDTDELIVWRHS